MEENILHKSLSFPFSKIIICIEMHEYSRVSLVSLKEIKLREGKISYGLLLLLKGLGLNHLIYQDSTFCGSSGGKKPLKHWGL